MGLQDRETAPGGMATVPANHSSGLAGTGKSWEASKDAAPSPGALSRARTPWSPAQPPPGSAGSSPCSLFPSSCSGPRNGFAASRRLPRGIPPMPARPPGPGLSPATGALLQICRKRRNNKNNNNKEQTPYAVSPVLPPKPAAGSAQPGWAGLGVCPPVRGTRRHPMPKAPRCSSRLEPPSCGLVYRVLITNTSRLAGAGPGAGFYQIPFLLAGHWLGWPQPGGRNSRWSGHCHQWVSGHGVPTATPW